MQNGNWVPISKYFSYALPKNRKFNDLEVMYSLQLDYDNNNTITILGCSARWGWSRTKVINFLLEHEIIISYPDELKSLRKKRGFIDIHPDKKRHKKKHKEDNKETIKEHKRFIDSKWIADKKNNKKAMKGHKEDNKKVTTIDPNIILNPNPLTNKDNFIKELPKSVFKKGHSEEQVLSTIDNLIDYCKAKGKTYKDYYAALRNFLKNVPIAGAVNTNLSVSDHNQIEFTKMKNREYKHDPSDPNEFIPDDAPF